MIDNSLDLTEFKPGDDLFVFTVCLCSDFLPGNIQEILGSNADLPKIILIAEYSHYFTGI